jgi:hypothetical protein
VKPVSEKSHYHPYKWTWAYYTIYHIGLLVLKVSRCCSLQVISNRATINNNYNDNCNARIIKFCLKNKTIQNIKRTALYTYVIVYSFDCVNTHSFSCINDDVFKILKTIELDRSEIREVNSSLA